MDASATFLLDLGGAPVQPVQPSDLQPLRESVERLVTALEGLQPAVRAHRITLNLAPGVALGPLALGGLTRVRAVTVVDLTGPKVPQLRLGGPGECALPLAKGDVRQGLDVGALYLSCEGGGGQLVLELHGR